MAELGPMELAMYTNNMSDQQKMLFMQQYGSSKKDRTIALVLSLFLGTLGVDRFYLGDTGLGIGKLLTAGGLGFWAIVDWFLIMGRADQVNRQIAQNLAMTSQFMNNNAGGGAAQQYAPPPPPMAAPSAPPMAPPAPPAAQRALIVASGGQQVARLNLIPGTSYRIGREEGSHVTLSDPRVSSNHATIDVQPDSGVAIRDLDSTNGTFIGGSRLTGAVLITPGSTVQFGDTQLSFSW